MKPDAVLRCTSLDHRPQALLPRSPGATRPTLSHRAPRRNGSTIERATPCDLPRRRRHIKKGAEPDPATGRTPRLESRILTGPGTPDQAEPLARTEPEQRCAAASRARPPGASRQPDHRPRAPQRAERPPPINPTAAAARPPRCRQKTGTRHRWVDRIGSLVSSNFRRLARGPTPARALASVN